MTSLISLLSALLITGTVASFVPDGPNSASFSEGELFLSPVAGLYKSGFSIGGYKSKHDLLGEGDMLIMSLAKGFSMKRWYLDGTKIFELSGFAGFKNYYSYPDLTKFNIHNSQGLQLLNNDYRIGYNMGYLSNSVVFRLAWGYERKEISRQFISYLNENSANQQDRITLARATERPLLENDYLELLLGGITANLRYYFAYGQYINIEPDLAHQFGRWGIDYRGASKGNVLRLVMGLEQSFYEYNNWGETNRVTIGMEKSSSPINGWQILAQWSSGNSDYSPYYDAHGETTGFSFNLIF